MLKKIFFFMEACIKESLLSSLEKFFFLLFKIFGGFVIFLQYFFNILPTEYNGPVYIF